MAKGYYDDILGEKGHRYRRVFIPLCIVLAAILLLPGLDYSGLSFFGIKPGTVAVDPEIVIIVCLAVLAGYHGGFFAFHAYEDWVQWWGYIKPVSAPSMGGDRPFAELCMYFRREPSERLTSGRWGALQDLAWIYSEGPTNANWQMEHKVNQPNGEQRVERNMPFSMPTAAVRSVRRKVRMYIYSELGIPALALALLLVAASIRLIPLVWTGESAA